MPLKLFPPRAGKSPNFTIRGTHLRVYVDKSSGTPKRSVARKIRDELERKIERGEYPPKESVAAPGVVTFLSAAVAYMEAGGERKYMAPLIRHFGETPAADIGQAEIDAAAIALLPNSSGANRNRAVYTPVHAVLEHNGLGFKMRRPKGAKGKQVTAFLMPPDAFAIIREAESFDREFAALLTFLLYTGCRLGEALSLRWDDVDLETRSARIQTSKNDDPRQLLLRTDVCDALRVFPRRDGRVFRFHQGGWLKGLLLRAKLAACGLPMPARPRTKGERRKTPPHRLSWVNFHTFCHTWATWMRRYSGLDVKGLVATGRWRDERSASRYSHAVPRDEWQGVDNLPAREAKKA